MRAILSDIRALAGVTGIAVLGKKDGRIEHLFPAAFTERHTDRLLALATQTYQRLRGFNRLTLQFERVVVHLFNQAEYLLFVTALPDTNVKHFEQIIASKLERIGRELAKAPAAGVHQHLATGGKRKDPVNTLIQVLNDMSAKIAPSHGITRIAADWRKARDQAATEHEVLAALSVDPTGGLALRKGRSLEMTAEATRAFLHLAEIFFGLIGTSRAVAEETFFALLERERTTLEPCGVFLFLNAQFQRRSAQ
jgi:hypothetical protein